MPRHSLFHFGVQYIAAAIVFTSLAAVARAQGSAGADTVLGQRYVEADFGASTYHGISQSELHGGVGAQIPLVNHLDGDVAYSRSNWRPTFDNGLFVEHAQTDTAFAGLTTYTNLGKIRAFGGAGFYREWQHETFTFAGMPVLDTRQNASFWTIDAGTEVTVHRIVITPSIGYTHRFRQDPYLFAPRDRGALFYGLETHRWFTARIGGFARATYDDPQSRAFLGSWIYTTGIRTGSKSPHPARSNLSAEVISKTLPRPGPSRSFPSSEITRTVRAVRRDSGLPIPSPESTSAARSIGRPRRHLVTY